MLFLCFLYSWWNYFLILIQMVALIPKLLAKKILKFTKMLPLNGRHENQNRLEQKWGLLSTIIIHILFYRCIWTHNNKFFNQACLFDYGHIALKKQSNISCILPIYVITWCAAYKGEAAIYLLPLIS